MDHVKVYNKYFGYGDQVIPVCEICGRFAHSVHHVYNKGSHTVDNSIENLMALCKEHHDYCHAHNTREMQAEMKRRHLEFIKQFNDNK